MRADRTDRELVDDLLELYSIDALDAAETAAFESALAAVDAPSRLDAVDEIRRTRDAVARMAAEHAVTPGLDVRARTLDAVAQATSTSAVPGDRGDDPQPHEAAPIDDPTVGDELAVRRARRRRAALAASSAAAVLILVFVGVVVGRSTAPDSTTGPTAAQSAQLAQLRAVVASPDTQTRRGDLSGSPGSVVVASSRAKNLAVVLLDGAPALPASQTYQLWLIGDRHTPRSAGLIARSGATAVVGGGLADSDIIGMTVEPDGGSPRPTGAILTTVPV